MNTVQKIERLKAALDEHHRIFEALSGTIGLDIDGPLATAMFEVCNVAISATAENVGVDRDALDWFIFENRYGAKKYEAAKPGGDPVIIDSIGVFLEFETGGAK